MSGKPGMRSDLPTTLPARFSRRFAWDLDRRSVLAREVAQDLYELWTDLGGYESLSAMERVLCERATFIRQRLLQHETAVLAGQDPPMTVHEHVGATNSLLGILKALGLRRRAKEVGSLREYLAASAEAPVEEEGADAADDAA